MASTWRRPNKVDIVDQEIRADFSSAKTYPLSRALAEQERDRQGARSEKGRALRDLGTARTHDEIASFVRKWGFLRDDGGGNEERSGYAVAHFAAERAYIMALAGLATALRGRGNRSDAVKKYWQSRYDPSLLGPVFGFPWDSYEQTRAKRQEACAGGQPTEYDRLIEPVWKLDHPDWPLDPPGPCYVAHLLAQSLSIPTRLHVVKRDQRWALEDTPEVDTLEKALLWSLRYRLGVVQYRHCEECGGDFLADRPNQRFCRNACGNLSRVHRHRRKAKKGKQRGGRKVRR